MKKILITSALPYANGPLHFGHIAGAYLPGDCYARFQRLMGNDVLFICGSDEYGMAITLTAEMAGRSPQEHVDIYHRVISDFFKTLEISFDHYSRTTSPFHKKPVHQFFLDLLANGYIEERMTEQLYSEKEGRFMADRYVVGTCPSCGFAEARGDECPKCGASYEATDLKNPRSKLTGSPLTKRPTKHWFLLLDKFQDQLHAFVDSKNWKPNVTNYVKGYIKELKPRAITRDIEWGLPVPLEGAQGKVLYVWFDAVIGYISATMEWAASKGKPDLWKEYWEDPSTKLVQFIGKDNIPFHAVIFPAMIMGQNAHFILVDELPANEFYNLEGRQFSKSDGWYIDLEDFFKKYTADQIRYTIAANAPETQDSEFTWKDFQLRCNSELLGKLGNFVNRVMVFAKNNTEGKVPERGEASAVDEAFEQDIQKSLEEIKNSFENFRLRKAAQVLMELAQKGNAYFDFKKPWKEADTMRTTIALCLEAIKALAVMASPIIPETAAKMAKMLAIEGLSFDARSLPAGHKLGEPVILFRKVEDAEIEAESAKLKTLKKEKEMITIDQFKKTDLRVGQVKTAEKVEKSKNLLKLTVDLGTEVRTIVSGIAGVVAPEEMVGKKVVVVANLAPHKIMGIESQGMILCGSGPEGLEVVTLESSTPGAEVR
jgi:methionyl-tRNA synthetase